jgi:hypothetical protein
MSDRTIHGDTTGRSFEGSANVLVGDHQQRGHKMRAKIEVRIVHHGGAPAALEPYELLCDEGSVVAAGVLDEDGWLRVADVEWRPHSVRLLNGWIVSLR